MKLIGSKTEQEYRDQLIRSNQVLFQSNDNKRLLETISTMCPNFQSAYILHSIPDQSEEILEILVDESIILVIELDRFEFNVKPKADFITLAQYKKNLSKQRQIKLEVALDLAKKDNTLG